jgi:hypothetical protein
MTTDQRGERWEFGVPVMHGNAALRDRFYLVVNDLRDAGCIVDIWVNDIVKTLEQFGYRVDIFMPEKP